MANPLRDMSVIMQGLVAAAIAVVLVLVGIYLPFSPVAQEKDRQGGGSEGATDAGSATVAGLSAAIRRAEAGDGRAEQATGYVEVDRAGRKRD